jgi:hypothetical protein
VRFFLALFLTLLSLPALTRADQLKHRQQLQEGISVTEIQSSAPAETAHIAKYYVDKAAPGSDYETGNLHIIYTDGTEVIEKIPLKEKSTEANTVYNQEGISDIEVAADKRTIGWTAMVDNCCTSYSVPVSVAIYQSGKKVLHIQQGQMVWYWTFLNGGKRVSVVWGPTHGAEVGDYQLYDAKTGRMLSEVFGEEEIQGLAPNAPKWAKLVEEQMHKRRSIIYP